MTPLSPDFVLRLGLRECCDCASDLAPFLASQIVDDT